MISTRAKGRLALREAQIVFSQEVRPALDKLGARIISRVRSKMRLSSGRERRNVSDRIRGSSYRLKLVISGDLPQTLVDEEGRRKGAKLAPWKQGSELYAWVGRRGFVGASNLETRRRTFRFEQRTFDRSEGKLRTRTQSAVRRQESIAFLIARKNSREGIHARRPFERTAEEARVFVRLSLEDAFRKAVARLNA